MDCVEVEKIPPELLGAQLEVAFRQKVGEWIGSTALTGTPDVIAANGEVSPDWLDYQVVTRLQPATHEGRHVLKPKRTPG